MIAMRLDLQTPTGCALAPTGSGAGSSARAACVTSLSACSSRWTLLTIEAGLLAMLLGFTGWLGGSVMWLGSTGCALLVGAGVVGLWWPGQLPHSIEILGGPIAAAGGSILRHQHPREAERLNGAMHSLTRTTHPRLPSQQERLMATKLDVRQLIPMERHRLIFETYGSLKSSEAFERVNDHDPKPLYYQFDAEHNGQFSWKYLEQGPQTLRVEIGHT